MTEELKVAVDRKAFEAALRGSEIVPPLEMPVRPVWAAGT